MSAQAQCMSLPIQVNTALHLTRTQNRDNSSITRMSHVRLIVNKQQLKLRQAAEVVFVQQVNTYSSRMSLINVFIAVHHKCNNSTRENYFVHNEAQTMVNNVTVCDESRRPVLVLQLTISTKWHPLRTRTQVQNAQFRRILQWQRGWLHFWSRFAGSFLFHSSLNPFMSSKAFVALVEFW